MNESDDILSVLSDDQSRKIMKVLTDAELSIQQISHLLNIPQSTAYRKVRKLEELRIIKKTKIIRTIEGLDESYYKNWTHEIIVTFKEGILAHVIEHVKMEDKIIRLWQKFSD